MKRPKRKAKPKPLRLDVPAYIAYLKMLHGNVDGAIAALERYRRIAG